jgi:fluoride ion exporter CrcB/FEX
MTVNNQRRTTVATTVGVLVVVYAATFLLGALLHLGVRIPVGFAVLSEPRIVPATIVEGFCALVLTISAYAVFTHKGWAWPAVTSAHAFALAGVLLGMVALAVGAGPRTELNDIYHRVMLVMLVAGLAFLSMPIARAALGRANRPLNADER